jgi:translation elongation factor EF-Tu-like GTPase
MNDLKAVVEIKMFSAEQSGKTRGYKNGVRPNHYIHELGCTVIGQIDFGQEGGIELGETKLAKISYIHWEPFEKILCPSLQYEVREGSRIVGEALVKHVL